MFGVRAVIAPVARAFELRLVIHVARSTRYVESTRRNGRTNSAVNYLLRMRFRMPIVSGGYVEKAIPDPIPNSEVKLLGADGTARATVWESRTLPG